MSPVVDCRESKSMTKKGQSTVEYLLLFAALVLVILAVLKGSFTGKMKNYYTNASDVIENIPSKLGL